ncbi:MAG: LysE family translocator [Alphaproteobacteria bacterium]|nr:LysE family translocator [Alphaproteobacteria bacterium]
MNTAMIGAFLLLAVPAFFTPGPNNLMLMTSTARFGVARTLPHAIGIVVGFPFMVFVVALGLGEVFAAFPALKLVLKYLAAAYLLWMAWNLLGLRIGEGETRERPLRPHEAILFQWINPKGWVMATSLAAAFVSTGPDRLFSVAAITLGCLVLSPLSTGLWMLFGESLQAFLKKTGTERFLGAVLALLMVAAVIMFFI